MAIFEDAPSTDQIRTQHAEEHFQYLARHRDKTVVAGCLRRSMSSPRLGLRAPRPPRTARAVFSRPRRHDVVERGGGWRALAHAVVRRDRADARRDDRPAPGGVSLTTSASRAAASAMTSGAKPVKPSISAGRDGACA